MPREMQFGAGSVIYFQGDGADVVYLLRKGGVSLVWQDIETGEDQRDKVASGEFFGVASALGKFRREENAAASQDSVVLIYTVDEFERLAMSNSRIMMTMLRVFSRQLRQIHKKVADLAEPAQENPEDALFNAGQFYLKSGRFVHARHVFDRYLTYYPTGRHSALASRCLEAAEARAAGILAPMPVEKKPVGKDAGKARDFAALYLDAQVLFREKEYQKAFEIFHRIAGGTENEYAVKSHFDMGRCLFQQEKYGDCIKFFTQMLMKYPKHPSLAEALFLVGRCHAGEGREEQAAGFYRKALTLCPAENGALRARINGALTGAGGNDAGI